MLAILILGNAAASPLLAVRGVVTFQFWLYNYRLVQHTYVICSVAAWLNGAGRLGYTRTQIEPSSVVNLEGMEVPLF